jgi:hypothetical protein
MISGASADLGRLLSTIKNGSDILPIEG